MFTIERKAHDTIRVNYADTTIVSRLMDALYASEFTPMDVPSESYIMVIRGGLLNYFEYGGLSMDDIDIDEIRTILSQVDVEIA